MLQDEIAQSLRPNQFTPEGDIQQMRKFYLERVAEIVKNRVGDASLQSIRDQLMIKQQQVQDLSDQLGAKELEIKNLRKEVNFAHNMHQDL